MAGVLPLEQRLRERAQRRALAKHAVAAVAATGGRLGRGRHAKHFLRARTQPHVHTPHYTHVGEPGADCARRHFRTEYRLSDRTHTHFDYLPSMSTGTPHSCRPSRSPCACPPPPSRDDHRTPLPLSRTRLGRCVAHGAQEATHVKRRPWPSCATSARRWPRSRRFCPHPHTKTAARTHTLLLRAAPVLNAPPPLSRTPPPPATSNDSCRIGWRACVLPRRPPGGRACPHHKDARVLARTRRPWVKPRAHAPQRPTTAATLTATAFSCRVRGGRRAVCVYVLRAACACVAFRVWVRGGADAGGPGGCRVHTLARAVTAPAGCGGHKSPVRRSGGAKSAAAQGTL